MLLLLAVAALLLWEEWRKEPGNRTLVVWTVVTILLLYTHGAGWLLLAALVVVNWFYGTRQRAFILAAAVSALAFLPWLLYVLPVYLSRGIEANVIAIRKDPLLALLQLPFFFLLGEDPGGGTPLTLLHTSELRPALMVGAGLIHLLLLVLAWRGIRRFWPLRPDRQDARRWFWITALLLGIPVGLLYIFSVLFTPALHARYLLLVWPGYWLLVALLGELGGRAGRATLTYVFLPLVLVSIGLILKQNMTPSLARQGTMLVAREMRHSDLILCDKHMPLGWQVYWEWTRRLGRSGQIEILSSRMPAGLTSLPPGRSLEELDLERIGRVWFFYSNTKRVQSVMQFLLAHGFVLEEPLSRESPALLVFTKPGSLVLPTQPSSSEHSAILLTSHRGSVLGRRTLSTV